MIKDISAIVLAAGQSTRMGRPKMILPWGNTTVIGQVVTELDKVGMGEILVVTGGAKREVELALQELPALGVTIRTVYNPGFAEGEMLSSFQVGLAQLGEETLAALVVLGDQPQIQEQVIQHLINTYCESDAPLVVPSYQMRRGHPWLVDRSLWSSALSLRPPETLRDFLQSQSSRIRYVNVDTDTIFQDLDTPGDYLHSKPGNPGK